MERKLVGRIGELVGESPQVCTHPSRTPHSLQKYLLPLIMGGREDRKQLELYGNAVKAVFQKHEGKLVELIEQEYQEQLRQAKQPQPAELPAYPD